jgi:hypothetical protein
MKKNVILIVLFGLFAGKSNAYRYNKPRVSDVKSIPWEIKTPQDYADGMDAIASCNLTGNREPDPVLRKRYEDMRSPKSTWGDIINILTEDFEKNPNKKKGDTLNLYCMKSIPKT